MSLLSELSDGARAALATAGPSTVSIGRHGRGAGVVVAQDRVLTNAHNLRDRTTQVTFADGRAEQGRVVGSDLDHDVVVLDVDTADVPALPWAEATAAVGDVVFAVGHTVHGQRVTFGTVSATDRAFRGPRGRRVKGALEHTAALGRGSSGGPVVDASGRFVGLNTHRLGEGFYLALAADAELRTKVDALAAGTTISRRLLGISVVPQEVARRLRSKVGLPDQAGRRVSGVVPGSPAATAGVSEGDLLVSIDGTAGHRSRRAVGRPRRRRRRGHPRPGPRRRAPRGEGHFHRTGSRYHQPRGQPHRLGLEPAPPAGQPVLVAVPRRMAVNCDKNGVPGRSVSFLSQFASHGAVNCDKNGLVGQCQSSSPSWSRPARSWMSASK